MADQAAQKPPLRHPAEIPTFIVMVVLNVAILAILIDFLVSAALIPPALRGTNWELTIRAVAGAIVLVAPALLIGRARFQDRDAGLGLRDVNLQFGQYPPDLIVTRAHRLSSPGLYQARPHRA